MNHSPIKWLALNIRNNYEYFFSCRLTTKKIEETPNASIVVDLSKKSTRQFDGLSFFGGILTVFGIAAIAFFGIKSYQSKRIINEGYNLNLM